MKNKEVCQDLVPAINNFTITNIKFTADDALAAIFNPISVKITLESNEDKEWAEKRINDIFDNSGYLTIMDDAEYNGTIKFIAMMPNVLALSNFITKSEWNVRLSDDVIKNNYEDTINLLRRVYSKCTDIDQSKNCLSDLVSMMQDQAVLNHIRLDKEPAYAKI